MLPLYNYNPFHPSSALTPATTNLFSMSITLSFQEHLLYKWHLFYVIWGDLFSVKHTFLKSYLITCDHPYQYYVVSFVPLEQYLCMNIPHFILPVTC